MVSALSDMLATGYARDAGDKKVKLHSNLGTQAVEQLQRLVRTCEARQTLEIGMAMGVSTLAILEATSEATHAAIDPNQTSEASDGWRGIGLANVERSGFSSRFTLIEEPSFTALPRVLARGDRYDLILIDGWHSFDHTFIDFFYSDLLLRDGGILVIDDWGMPQVWMVTKFIDEHKHYQKIGPRTFNRLNLLTRLLKQEEEWGSICAYRKLGSNTVPWGFFHSSFYPHYRYYRLWGKLRGHEVMKPY
jgi:predicted O-methyltransferase YrrM